MNPHKILPTFGANSINMNSQISYKQYIQLCIIFLNKTEMKLNKRKTTMCRNFIHTHSRWWRWLTSSRGPWPGNQGTRSKSKSNNKNSWPSAREIFHRFELHGSVLHRLGRCPMLGGHIKIITHAPIYRFIHSHRLNWRRGATPPRSNRNPQNLGGFAVCRFQRL